MGSRVEAVAPRFIEGERSGARFNPSRRRGGARRCVECGFIQHVLWGRHHRIRQQYLSVVLPHPLIYTQLLIFKEEMYLL